MPRPRSLRSLPLALAAVAAAIPAAHASDQTWRASVDTLGQEGSGDSLNVALSATGRYVVFASQSKDLVPNDNNFAWDIFLRDRGQQTLSRVSLTYLEQEANSDSFDPTISDDGRYIAFESRASNLIKNDSNGVQDVFVRDRVQQNTLRVSNGIGQPNGASYSPKISGDGRWVVYYSSASNLVGNDANGALDVFLYDIQFNTTLAVSVGISGWLANGGSRAARISQDGRWAVFASDATDLVPSDSNGARDIFLRDLQVGTLSRVTEGFRWEANADSDEPDVSSNGRFITFDSQGTNFPGIVDTNGGHDIVVYDTFSFTYERVSVGPSGEANGASRRPTISGDGNDVAFTSYATNLYSGDVNGVPDVFVHDRSAATTTLMSAGASGPGNQRSEFCDISESGDYVGFRSDATNLVTGDTNSRRDVFLRGPQFLFDLTPRVYYAFDPFEFLVFPGVPPDPILVAVLGVNGQPFFQVVATGRFDSQGAYSLQGTIPAGLAGLTVDLQALVSSMGQFQWTNPVEMQLR